MSEIEHLRDIYRFPGFVARARVKTKPGDASAIVITLARRRKKRSVAAVAKPISATTTFVPASSATSLLVIVKYTSTCRCVVSIAASAA